MRKKELLARIEALERRVEELEAAHAPWNGIVPEYNGTWWPKAGPLVLCRGDRGETVTRDNWSGHFSSPFEIEVTGVGFA